ncbi:Lactonase, 7-bladed beta-propeller-domain-containing protein [Xylaria intraflava]|nr:Lactonase, 7-bladed beta-propeller-domain-containing protein [Xylaria intraflava]
MPLPARLLPALLALPAHVFGMTLLASHYTGKIYKLSFDNNTLTVDSSTEGAGTLPSWLSLDTKGGVKTVYSVDEDFSGSGVLASFSVGTDGSLTQTGQQPSEGGSVCGTPYADSKFFASVEYNPSTLTTYTLPFEEDGEILQQFKFTMAAPGPNSRQDAPHPHSTYVDPTGNFLLVPDLGADLVRIFSINATTGELTTCPPGEAGPGDGPRHATFWAPSSNLTTGLMVYTVNELGNSVTSWSTSYPEDGCLTLNRLQTLKTYAGDSITEGTKAAEVHVAGNFLYAANRADETFGSEQDSMATYSIDPATGNITWVEATDSYTWFPRTFQINKAQTLLAIGGQTSSNVAIVRRDPETGLLGDLVASVQVATPGHAQQEDGLSDVIWVE